MFYLANTGVEIRLHFILVRFRHYWALMKHSPSMIWISTWRWVNIFLCCLVSGKRCYNWNTVVFKKFNSFWVCLRWVANFDAYVFAVLKLFNMMLWLQQWLQWASTGLLSWISKEVNLGASSVFSAFYAVLDNFYVFCPPLEKSENVCPWKNSCGCSLCYFFMMTCDFFKLPPNKEATMVV